MNFLINGYFGFANAGDEAVLAAMLADLRALAPGATFTATSGDPSQTRALHGCEAVGRQAPREVMEAIKKCDVFLSGGGSLLQDVTSVRNVVYYTGMLRMARLARRPTMMYAQGVGPLHSPVSRKLAQLAFGSADVATVRDPDSALLLRMIGVGRAVEITADPVWNLRPAAPPPRVAGRWVVALRSWPGADEQAVARIVETLRAAAAEQRAQLKFLAMQPGPDDEVLSGLVEAGEKLETRGQTPAEIVALAASGDLMIAMRLHALIFAASQGVATVALGYDPKVAALAKLWDCPLLESPSPENLAALPHLLRRAQAPSAELRHKWQSAARHNAELAVGLR